MKRRPQESIPRDTESEAGALACVLSAEPGDAEGMLDKLEEAHFEDIRHLTVFRALLACHEDGEPLNAVSLWQKVKGYGSDGEAGGFEYVSALPDATPSPINFPTFLSTIQDRAERRRMLDRAEKERRAALDLAKPVIAPTSRPHWLEFVEDGATMQVCELPPVVEIASGIVAERAKLVICSGSKSYKTWLTIDLALSIAHGVPFLERETVRTRVLYVNLELKPDTFTRRLQAVAEAKGISIASGWFNHLPLRGKLSGLGIEEAVTRLVANAKHLGCRVVVLDPCYKLNVEGDENSTRDQTLFFNAIDRLTTEAEATVILNDHAGKGNQSEKDPLDVIRGSSAKGGDLDAAFVLRRHDVENSFRVDLIHRELAPVDPFVIGWEYPLMQLRPDLDAENMKKAKGGRHPAHEPGKLLAAIKDCDENHPISISAWSARAGIPRGTLTGYLEGFRVKGWIRTHGDGRTARNYITTEGLALANKHGGEE